MVDLVRDLRDRESDRAVGVRLEIGAVHSCARTRAAGVRAQHDRAQDRSTGRRRSAVADRARACRVTRSIPPLSQRALARDPADVEERLESWTACTLSSPWRARTPCLTERPTLRCRFVHVLYQNALYASLRATRRASLSAAVANAMIASMARSNTAIASELAATVRSRAGSRPRRPVISSWRRRTRCAVFAFVETAAIAERGLEAVGRPPGERREPKRATS